MKTDNKKNDKKNFDYKAIISVVLVLAILATLFFFKKLDGQEYNPNKHLADSSALSVDTSADASADADSEKDNKKDNKKDSEEDSKSEKKISIDTPSNVDLDTVYSFEDVKNMKAGEIVNPKTLETLTDQNIDDLCNYYPISDEVFSRMNGVSFVENDNIKIDDLRYVKVLHMGFDGYVHVGELVCYYSIADDLSNIFLSLYKQGYPIEKMHLIDDYGGDDEASMADNNTSCFNYRAVSGSDELSMHAYGKAIDINPLYNPYITSDGVQPEDGEEYTDRSKSNEYFLTGEDICSKEFLNYKFDDGNKWTWGGYWSSVKDYQHFEVE